MCCHQNVAVMASSVPFKGVFKDCIVFLHAYTGTKLGYENKNAVNSRNKISENRQWNQTL
jgi:hypothetical protein